MSGVKITGHVDERHMLSAQVPPSIPSGPVTVWIVPAAPVDEEESHWMSSVAGAWADELGDERQDIYSLDDGEPLDAA
jgi:hypothetical protein